jgi:hypothetical protein
MAEHFYPNGSVLLSDDANPARTQLVPDRASLPAARLAFFGPDLSYPTDLTVTQLRLYLTSTGQISAVTSAIAALPANLRALANIEFQTSPAVTLQMARFLKQVLALDAAGLAALLRAAAAFGPVDYGAP